MSVGHPPTIGLLRGQLLADRAGDALPMASDETPSLPAPIRPPSPPWFELAACRGRPLSWWFTHGNAFESRVAITVCRSCPVRMPCLAYALEHDDDASPSGIYGGISANQRVALRRRGSASRVSHSWP